MTVDEGGQPRRDRLDDRAERLRPGCRGGTFPGECRPVQRGQQDVAGQRTAAEQGDSGQQSDGSPPRVRSARTRHVPDC
ncbi:hypothetical protein [Plantactinospora sp. WMMB782]|uniref:hypothetical protein n=1 Tax=Plantactinospora sp. WMMB782 TaxID=3404121 RepID=UPI003B926073